MPTEVAERALGHKRPTIERTYDRHKFADELLLAYEKLARLVEQIAEQPADNVVPMRAQDIAMAKHLRSVRATDRQPSRKPIKDWLTYDRMKKIIYWSAIVPMIPRELYARYSSQANILKPYQTWIQIDNLTLSAKNFSIDWITSLPKEWTKSAPSRRLTDKQICDLVAEYRATTPNPSARGLAEFAKGRGVIGHRKELRAELKSQIGRRGAGRPRK